MFRGATAIAKFIAVIALVVGAGAALLVSGVRPVGAQMPVVVDYDVDDNGLIEVSDLAQLNAMRWDLDGDGDPAAANTSSYLLAFPGRDAATSTLMGCPMGNCAGYELMADLTFPAETSGPYNPWTPIGTYNGQFDGNGRALTNLTVEQAGNAGLFAALGGSSAIRNLALVNPRVTLTAHSLQAGALVGEIPVGSPTIDSVAVMGGRIAVEHATTTNFRDFSVGGLAGSYRSRRRHHQQQLLQR